MTLRFDVLTVGSGPGALIAARDMAASGLAVGILPADSQRDDPVGAYPTALLKELGADFRSGGVACQTVIENRLMLLSAGAGTALSFRAAERTQHPETLLAERGAVDQWLMEEAKKVGAALVAASKPTALNYDEKGRLAAVETANGFVRCKALVVGSGGESLLGHRTETPILPGDAHIPTRRLLRGTRSFQLSPETLRERFGLDDGQAVEIRALGAPLSPTPGCGWLHVAGDRLILGVALVSDPFADGPEALVSRGLDELAAHPLLTPLLRGARSGAESFSNRPAPGYRALPELSGRGWVLTGIASGLADPLRPENVHYEMISGVLAAKAVARALTAGDASARAFGVYRHMLDDSVVVKNLKAQRDAVDALERDPSLVSYYSDFVNRWFAHDTSDSLEPACDRNAAFFKNLRNERPVWEFAMGMRKGLKILRNG